MLNQIKIYIRQKIKRLVFGAQASPDIFLEYLKKQGLTIGEGTYFFDPIHTVVDTQNPKLVTIGKNVRITSGCKLLTHDFSWSVIGGGTGECIGAVGSIDIGDNVFIGVNTVILRNTQIGSNIIIGAGSIVSGMLEDNGVYAGNPAKRIMTIEEFYQKRKDRRQTEIANILSRIDTTNKEEIWKYLREYSCFFKDAPADVQRQIMLDTGYLEKCKTFYANNAPSYKIENFIN